MGRRRRRLAPWGDLTLNFGAQRLFFLLAEEGQLEAVFLCSADFLRRQPGLRRGDAVFVLDLDA